MGKILVVSPDQMPDQSALRKYLQMERERINQLLRGLDDPAKGLTLDHHQGLIEHRNPFSEALRVKPKVEIEPPANGRIYTVRVRVDYARSWEEAVRSAGPNTPDSYNVWKVGDQYPPEPKARSSKRSVKIVLANFGPGSVTPSASALEWGKQYHLRPAIPRECFAVGEHRPNLNRDLGFNYMVVVSLVKCSFGGCEQVSSVWWRRSGRESSLYWFTGAWYERYWFAFVRE